MPKFTEIIDSQTDNVNSKTTNYPGTAGSKEARGHTSSVAERQESQRKGAEGIGLNEQSYNEDQADFNQTSGSYDASSTSGRVPSLPWKP